MDTVAAELAERRVDIVAVCGGDGSQFRALSALRKAWPGDDLPLFLPLRAGTMNYIARSIGCMRGGPEHVLAYLANYTHRIAISNRRIRTFDGETVTFYRMLKRAPSCKFGVV